MKKRIEEIEEGNIDVNLEEYAKKEDLPSKTSEFTNDSNFADEKYVDDAIDFLEKVQLSDEMPTDAGVIMWVNTSEDMNMDGVARINDKVISSNNAWSSEKINILFNSLRLVREGNIVKLMLGNTELSNILIEDPTDTIE